MGKQKLVFFSAAVLLIIAILYGSFRKERSIPGRISTLANEEYLDLAEDLTLDQRRAYDGYLVFDGVRVPYDKSTATYYLPSFSNSSILDERIRWSDIGADVSLVSDGLSLLDAISSGERFPLLIRNGKRYFTEFLVFTGLPAISVRIEQETSYIFDRGLPAGEIAFIGDGASLLCYATCRLRGNLSSKLDKVPYRLTLFRKDGSRLSTSLAGLPASDEWILNAMYSEPSRLRDKFCLETWNAIAETDPNNDCSTSSFSYVELFYNDEYLGLYGLMNPISGESLELTANDTLFKASEWETPTVEALVKYSDTLDGGTTGVSIKWPRALTDRDLWDPMLGYVDRFFENRDRAVLPDADQGLNRKNLVDYSLFFLMTTPRDNYFSNTYYLVRSADGKQELSRIPWDLNCTLGNCVTATTRTHCKQDYTIANETLLPGDASLLMQAGSPWLFDALKTRYLELRTNAFSETLMINRLRADEALLADSGAMAREIARWPEGDIKPDAEPIVAFIINHLDVLDAYFNKSPRAE